MNNLYYTASHQNDGESLSLTYEEVEGSHQTAFAYQRKEYSLGVLLGLPVTNF